MENPAYAMSRLARILSTTWLKRKIFAMNMSIIVAEAVAMNSTIILTHGNISLTTLFQVR